MTLIRAFIAIDLAVDIRRKLGEVSAELKLRLKEAPVRWVSAENIHLTLKFLGDVSLANLEVLKKILRAETAHHSPFEVSVGDLGAFPSTHRPRVIWVKVQGPSELAAIQHSVEAETARLGYTREDRPFSPHLTLGRISRNASMADIRLIGAALENFQVGFLGAMRVESVNLYRSDLRPSGAVYTCLSSAPLGRLVDNK